MHLFILRISGLTTDLVLIVIVINTPFLFNRGGGDRLQANVAIVEFFKRYNRVRITY